MRPRERILLSLETFLLNDSTYEVSFIQVLACLRAVQFILCVIIFLARSRFSWRSFCSAIEDFCAFLEQYLKISTKVFRYFFRCNRGDSLGALLTIRVFFASFSWPLLKSCSLWLLIFWCFCCYRLNLLHNTTEGEKKKCWRAIIRVLCAFEINMMNWMFHWLLWRMDGK